MRALVLERHGEPEEVLRLVEMAAPQPGPGEVRVRMRLSPVNPSDFNTIRGDLPAEPGTRDLEPRRRAAAFRSGAHASAG